MSTATLVRRGPYVPPTYYAGGAGAAAARFAPNLLLAEGFAKVEAFDPVELLAGYGLVYWHDQRWQKYSDTGSTTVQTADGGAVAALQNAGSGANPTQGTAGQQGTLQLGEINNLDSLQLDGGDNYDATWAAGTLPKTFIAVVNVTNFTTQRCLFMSQTAGTGVKLTIIITTGVLQLQVDATAATSSTTALVAGATTVVAGKLTAAGAFSYFINGVKDASVGTIADTSPTAGSRRLGANQTPANFFLGQWPVAGECDGAVPDDVLVAVSQGLMRWYGLA